MLQHSHDNPGTVYNPRHWGPCYNIATTTLVQYIIRDTGDRVTTFHHNTVRLKSSLADKGCIIVVRNAVGLGEQGGKGVIQVLVLQWGMGVYLSVQINIANVNGPTLSVLQGGGVYNFQN